MEAIIDFFSVSSGIPVYLLVFLILLACGFGLPVPEDITLIAAGVAAYYGNVSVLGMILVAISGVLIGDSTIFFLGHKYGVKLTKKWPFSRVLTPDRLNSVRQSLHRHGNKLIFAARFMPGLRAPIYFSSGSLQLPFRIFLFYDGMAAMISVPAIIYAVYYFGDTLDYVVKMIKDIQSGIFILISVAVVAIIAKWYLGRKRLEQKQ